MQKPIQISARKIELSPALEEDIRRSAAKLEEFCDRITGCQVVVEARHRRHRRGNLYHVRIRLTVPGWEIDVSREPSAHHAHEDLHVTVHDAFDEARRQLEEYVRELRGATKTHAQVPHGRISKLFAEYGFIETPDGREVYFHAHSLLDQAFADVHVGQEVRFVEEQGDEGPQATSVRRVGRHHQLVD